MLDQLPEQTVVFFDPEQIERLTSAGIVLVMVIDPEVALHLEELPLSVFEVLFQEHARIHHVVAFTDYGHESIEKLRKIENITEALARLKQRLHLENPDILRDHLTLQSFDLSFHATDQVPLGVTTLLGRDRRDLENLGCRRGSV